MPISSSQVELKNSQLVVQSVESTGSPNGIRVVGGSYGSVILVASGVTAAAAGDFIAFRQQEFPVEINYLDESYFVIPESDILYKELSPP